MVRQSTDADLSEKDVALLKTLEQWGWFVIKVAATDSEPPFAYSMGLYENFQHPEIILFGLDVEVMHRLINGAAKRIQRGQSYAEGHRHYDLFDGYPCEFRKVNTSRTEGLFNYATWYYKGAAFPALQLIWPDPEGLFPWEDGFDENFRKKQPILE